MWRKTLSAVTVLGVMISGGGAFAALASPALAKAQAQVPEVVLSSDFEDGTVQGWFRRGTAVLAASGAQAHTGEQSLLTTSRTAGWHGPAYDLLEILAPQAVYEFEVHVRLLEGSPTAPLQLTMQSVPESTGETTWTQIGSVPAATDQAWATITGRYQPPEPGFEFQVYVESAEPTLSYYLDDVTVTMIEPPPDVELPQSETGSVDFDTDLQRIDGFGFSQAFQRAAVMNGLFGLTPPENQQRVLDLLLDPETGAGFSILRLGIGSSPEDPYDLMKSIQPQDPGGPEATPQYEWDGYDGGQVWLARQAQEYGVERFYANAWSAPGYMKTNGEDANGGVLCGLPGTGCDADWRQAYADYLVQYAQFYAGEGIEITELAFTNEPDLTTSYASMRFDNEQMLDFIAVIGPTIAGSGLDVNLVCCDAAGWSQQAAYTRAIEAEPGAAQWVDIHSGHSYVSPARSPLPTEQTVWMSEYAMPSGTWNEAWDAGGPNSGLALANDIHDSLTLAEINAYITWFGASLGGTAAPIQLDGPEFHVSKRLWATAAYSRFVRPDAYRVPAQTSGQLMKVSAYRNADGRKVVNLINNRTSEVSLDLALAGVPAGSQVTSFRTDEAHSLAVTGTVTTGGGGLVLDLPPRSLTTLVLDDPALPPECTTTVTGTHHGGLHVAGGTTTCLAAGARVNGPVRVGADAGLIGIGATVAGPVQAKDPATVRLLDVTILGPLTVTGAAEEVTIAGSRIAGPVTVTGADTAPVPVLISGNRVAGPLSCRGNVPPPTDQGIGNTVAGPKLGQCREL